MQGWEFRQSLTQRQGLTDCEGRLKFVLDTHEAKLALYMKLPLSTPCYEIRTVISHLEYAADFGWRSILITVYCFEFTVSEFNVYHGTLCTM